MTDALPRAGDDSAWRAYLLDAGLVAGAFALLLTELHSVVLFHLEFLFLTLAALTLTRRPFLARLAVFGGIIHASVLLDVRAGHLQPGEALELPMMTAIVVLVFVVARRREDAHQLLDQERGFLAAVLETTDDGIVACDVDGRIIYANPVAARLSAARDSATAADPAGDVIRAAIQHGEYEPREFESATQDLVIVAGGRRLHNRSGRAIGAVAVLRDITHRRRYERELEHQARHDHLTGLGNRPKFDEQLRDAVGTATGAPIAVLFIDIDDFKVVNDDNGHLVGDRLLAAVGQRLVAATTPGTAIARLGGDEFAVLVERHPDPDAVARRIFDAIATPIVIGGRNFEITASIGLATGHSGSATADQLLREADIAMYMAKAQGKARIQVHDRSSHDAILERMARRTELRRAIESDAIIARFDTVVDLQSGTPVGVTTALVCGTAEGSHRVSAADAGDEAATSLALGRLELEAACTAAAAIACDGTAGWALVVISEAMLWDAELFSEIAAARRRTGVDADRLVLGVDESVIATLDQHAIAVLEGIASSGVRLALVDGGSGHAMLGALPRLRFDFVVIDGRAVATALDDPELGALGGAVCSLAGALGAQVVGRGLSTRSQAERLAHFGCELASGAPWPHDLSLDQLTKHWAA